MKLLIGLGNPGKKYLLNRHNVGFLFIDKMTQNFSWPVLKLNKNFQAKISKTKLDEKKIIVALPQTYMNNSGEVVKKISAYYKIKPQNIIVVHDEIDLPLGKFKASFDSRSAGHLGVQSIIDQLKTKSFWRLRIGIGPEKRPVNFSTEKFVLENFKKEELEKFSNLFTILNQEMIKLLE